MSQLQVIFEVQIAFLRTYEPGYDVKSVFFLPLRSLNSFGIRLLLANLLKSIFFIISSSSCVVAWPGVTGFTLPIRCLTLWFCGDDTWAGEWKTEILLVLTKIPLELDLSPSFGSKILASRFETFAAEALRAKLYVFRGGCIGWSSFESFCVSGSFDRAINGLVSNGRFEDAFVWDILMLVSSRFIELYVDGRLSLNLVKTNLIFNDPAWVAQNTINKLYALFFQ